MEDNIKMTLLYDIYGSLLTKKQKEIFEQYYIYNLSLREIAQNINISYQAVRDSIKNSKTLLLHYENVLGMRRLLNSVEKLRKMCQKEEVLNKESLLKLFDFKSKG